MRNPQCLPYQDASSRTIWKKKLVHFDIYAEITPYYNEPSGWKGSVTYGLGADISLPPCLATGIWTLAHPKSDLRAEISGSIVWYDALAPRPEVLRSFSPFYANNVLGKFIYAQASLLE